MKKYLSLLILAAVITACSNTNEPTITEYGTISLAIDAEQEVSVATRAATADELKDYLITIKQGDAVKLNATKYSALQSTDLTYAVGEGYTVSAESCTTAEAESANTNWGQARFSGTSSTFGIISGATTNVDFTCTMQNAKVSVVYDNTFTTTFTEYSVEIYESSNTTRKLTFTSAATEETPCAYFNIDSNPQLTYTIKGKFNNSATKELKTGTITLAPKQWSKLKISATANGQIQLGITIDNSVESKEENIEVNPYA